MTIQNHKNLYACTYYSVYQAFPQTAWDEASLLHTLYKPNLLKQIANRDRGNFIARSRRMTGSIWVHGVTLA